MSLGDIAVFGYNYIGLDVVKHLRRRGQNCVIADTVEERVQKARDDGFDAHFVDLTDDQTLLEAGLGKQLKIIFCLLDEDSQNVFLTISARSLDPNLNIISICRSEDANRKLIAAGVNKVINPYQISGRKIYEIIRKPEIVELLDNVVFGQTDLNMVEVTIESGSLLDQTYIDDFDIRQKFNLILLGVEDKELGHAIQFATSGFNHKLDAGDKLVVIGPTSEIEAFRQQYTAKSNSSSDL
jgi:voltage-gated potassium channel